VYCSEYKLEISVINTFNVTAYGAFYEFYIIGLRITTLSRNVLSKKHYTYITYTSCVWR